MPSNTGKRRERLLAEVGLSPVIGNAQTARTFAHGTVGELGLQEVTNVMREKVGKVQAGDLSGVEETLIAQAAALDAIFGELARRAAMNMGERLQATEVYLRLAFKAQAQCRATLQTLAEVKNPRPVAFVKQANIANGPQQINNGMAAPPPRAREEMAITANEVLTDERETQHAATLDTGATTGAGRENQTLEAVGVVNWAGDDGRQG
ncbi:hypothetical protein G5A69_09840 [Ralstonia mannitolilytica]|nr:hypothetical protein G5A69_09840 [Ralstonia mannitolilytica]